MRFEIKQSLRADAVHYYDAQSKDRIVSTGNRVDAVIDGESYSIRLPLSSRLRPLLLSRLARRASRLDKSNVCLNSARDGLVILYRGSMWFFDLRSRVLRPTGRLRQCRNVLHSGIAVTARGIFFGEYGANPRREPIPVWASRDDGRSWQVVWETPPGRKHIHGIYADPFNERLWIPTGDFAGECYLISADYDFSEIRVHGDGSQAWRPVSLFFTATEIAWVMDTQLETSFLQIFERSTGELTRHSAFPGPCWYSKQLADGWAVLQTTVEIGPGVLSDHVSLFASEDLRQWHEFARFKKDRWPMRYFKFGVATFADGPQTSQDFVVFGEAVKQLDGRAFFGGLAA